jgi:hypothetical protein
MAHGLRLAAALLALLTTGCAATRESPYFAPVAAPGVAVGSGWSTLPEIAQYRLCCGTFELALRDGAHPFGPGLDPKALADAKAGRKAPPGKASLVRLAIALPSGQSIRFLGTSLVATPKAGGPRVTATITRVNANVIEHGVGRFVEIQPGEALVGATYEFMAGLVVRSKVEAPRRFEIDAEFDGVLPDRFALALPAMTINDLPTTLPTVEFERKVGTAFDMAAP